MLMHPIMAASFCQAGPGALSINQSDAVKLLNTVLIIRIKGDHVEYWVVLAHTSSHTPMTPLRMAIAQGRRVVARGMMLIMTSLLDH